MTASEARVMTNDPYVKSHTGEIYKIDFVVTN